MKSHTHACKQCCVPTFQSNLLQRFEEEGNALDMSVHTVHFSEKMLNRNHQLLFLNMEIPQCAQGPNQRINTLNTRVVNGTGNIGMQIVWHVCCSSFFKNVIFSLTYLYLCTFA